MREPRPRPRRSRTAAAAPLRDPGAGGAGRSQPDDDRRPAGGRGARHRALCRRRARAGLSAALRQRRAAGGDGPHRAGRRLDLGRIATRVAAVDGRLVVEGEKIFITNGGSDVHLVLARDARAPAGAGAPAALSLVLCPAVLPDGRRNAVRVTRVEEKLGLHGSPTCVVRFEGAEAFAVGPPGGGLRAMLELMNLARLGVAAQAVGIAETAWQAAAAHAAAREQFGQPLCRHPLMLARLAEMRVDVSAARALVYRAAALLDQVEALRRYLRGERSRADPAREALRQAHLRRTRLARVLTSLAKFAAGEMSRRVTAAALQVHGGLGYMADAAVGQAHLDALVTTIYEGTSEIQVTFAASELARGVLATVVEQLAADVAAARDAAPELAAILAAGAGRLEAALAPVLRVPRLAQFHAARIGALVGDLCAGGAAAPGRGRRHRARPRRDLPRRPRPGLGGVRAPAAGRRSRRCRPLRPAAPGLIGAAGRWRRSAETVASAARLGE
ncbi:MAG: acyl-CoA dehydrogenase family protein [Candidatus Binatia bacterium]